MPSRNVIKKWSDKTPDNFKFTLKFPRIITHVHRLEQVSKYLAYFFYALEPILDKTLMLLIQLPPYLTAKIGLESLSHLLEKIDGRFNYALEVRESTWFDTKVYDFLKENKITLVWRVRDDLKTPTIITTDNIYLRFIGDRIIDKRHFGKNVKNREKEMNEYIEYINDAKHDYNINNIIVTFNNNYAGFGPQLASDFLKLINEPQKD